MQLAVLKLDSKNKLGFFFRTIPIGFERHFNIVFFVKTE